MANTPVAELITVLLAANKTMYGEPSWQDDPDAGHSRILVLLRIDGESTLADLTIMAYPLEGHNKFRIMINAPKCVWRVDAVSNEPHVNSLDRPPDLEDHVICEPHYHAWVDNKRFCSERSLPNSLLNARILPTEVRSFDNALRWFCGQTNIAQPAHGLISLPPRTRIL